MGEQLATDPHAISRAVREELVDDTGAWANGPEAVDGFLRRVVATLDRSTTAVVEHAEFDEYGSGYASFVEVFLTSRDGSHRRRSGDRTEIEGPSICLCRLAPLAMLLTPSVRTFGLAGYRSYPLLDRATTGPIPGWEQQCREALAVVAQHGFTLLTPATLALPIDPALRVDTAFTDRPPYTVYDAWFHWND